ncbi:nucleoside hydrolase [Roseicitreum antarcticum]|uniref:Pyrimidine-specific ribonucleoside hydrolase n=1 Tax=Roseicitreum antarcticum TaxID=564137 RepID=A0A1H2TQA3_9RHOB|nr:nucleoside hydrolase [Roseicitreum antarcticum]SDW45948.1 pyrimidine-specific ribonucleoside hydrolase [Roseicitreum antarcticum]
MTNALRVVIDTDPGIDDAVAILFALASPRFEVLGITTVAGNLGIDVTTRNAGRILALAGRSDIPVIAGAATPLARRGFDTAEIHGAGGLGGVDFPEPQAAAQGDAVAWLAGLLQREPAGSVEILALGPLTNIARLIADYPGAAARVRRIIAMGGAVEEPGNIGPRSEFNMAADPEAAQIVLTSPLAVTLVPLDVTRRVRATLDHVARLAQSARPGAQASAALIQAYFQSTEGRESRPLHDPCVMLLAEAPELFDCSPLRLSVDLRDDPGALGVVAGEGGPQVALQVRGADALSLLLDRLTTG